MNNETKLENGTQILIFETNDDNALEHVIFKRGKVISSKRKKYLSNHDFYCCATEYLVQDEEGKYYYANYGSLSTGDCIIMIQVDYRVYLSRKKNRLERQIDEQIKEINILEKKINYLNTHQKNYD